jgi:hypothetical protein
MDTLQSWVILLFLNEIYKWVIIILYKIKRKMVLKKFDYFKKFC